MRQTNCLHFILTCLGLRYLPLENVCDMHSFLWEGYVVWHVQRDAAYSILYFAAVLAKSSEADNTLIFNKCFILVRVRVTWRWKENPHGYEKSMLRNHTHLLTPAQNWARVSGAMKQLCCSLLHDATLQDKEGCYHLRSEMIVFWRGKCCASRVKY